MSLFNELKRRNVLRVGAAYVVGSWLLIQVAETLFPLFGFDDTPARIVVIVLAIAFIPVMVLSWAFELTPEGLKKDSEVDRSQSIAPNTGKKLDRMIMIVLALALGYFAFDKFVLDPARDAQIAETSAQKGRSQALIESYGESSIAVLPFVNMSDDPSNEYFSDGISEELLNLLAKVPKLRVISRSSSFTFKGKDIDIPTIAKQLGVAHILEGSVRKAENTVRITAQLIEARSDTHLWSETYDRELNNIFAIQDEISAAIVEVLKDKMGLEDVVAPRATATANTDAHEAYLRGRYLVVQRTPASIEGAMAEFEKAIAIDPDYALAHAELAIATLLLVDYGDLDESDAVTQAEPHSDRALVLDSLLPEAHAAAGRLINAREGHTAEELSRYEKAIELNPNYTDAWMWSSLNYRFSHPPQYDKALIASRTAAQLDPLSVPALHTYIIALVLRNKLAEADIELAKLASIAPPEHAQTRGWRLSMGRNWASGALGHLDFRLLEPQSPRHKNGFCIQLAYMGLEKEALAVFDPPSNNAYFNLGRIEEVLEKAEAQLAENPESEDAQWDVTFYSVLLGLYSQEGRDMWEEEWQDSTEGWNTYFYALLIDMRRSIDAEADVSEILSAMKETAYRDYDAGLIAMGDPDYALGLATFLEGDREKGLELIGKAMNYGKFIPPNRGYLHTLYDDSGFKPLLTAQEAKRTGERKKFLSIVCNENPYEAVWQPEAGTCEQFLTESGS